MKFFNSFIGFFVLLFGLISFKDATYNTKILSYTVDLSKQDLRFFWKDDKDMVIGNFHFLSDYVSKESKQLCFAMNGGMFRKDLSPQGLYIEDGKIQSVLDTNQKGYGNFYLKPNGVFYITKDNKGHVCKTHDFRGDNVKYATQSGPMLLIEGKIHADFHKESLNLNIRNGVGVLPNGNLLFAMSIGKINFYDFASYFRSKGCENALYLDGFVSKTYLPTKGFKDKNGNFGVIIGEIK